MTRRVYLHVGLPKTGTSSIQWSLWESRARLRGEDVDVPGAHKLAQRYAVWDLLGRRIQGAEQQHVPGSWARLVDGVTNSPAKTSLVSEELLVQARPRHVRRIVDDLAPVEVHVVVTLRNLDRVVASMWHQEILSGSTWTWDQYARAVAEPEAGPPTAGVGFWLRYNVEQVLSQWGRLVPADRTHIIVVPRSGGPRGRLLELYAAAVGVDSSALTVPDRLVNWSMGPAPAEVLRRLNLRLGGGISEHERQRLIKGALRPALRSVGEPAELRVPDGVRDALAARSQRLVAALRAAPQHVYGELDDLLPDPADPAGVDPERSSEAELLDAAMAALTAVCSLKAPRARQRPTPPAAETGLLTRMRSGSRALAFRMRTAALERADSNRGLAWASRRYLRRRSGQ